MKVARKERLSETKCAALLQWGSDKGYVVRDEGQRGLHLYVGPRGLSWFVYIERRIRGDKETISKKIGTYPHMSLQKARNEARRIVGVERHAPGPRKAVKFAEACNSYLLHLSDKAEAAGKEPQWRRRVESLHRNHLHRWDRYTLAELSANPTLVKNWHAELTKKAGGVTANRCAQVLRAIFKFAAKENRSLSIAELPTSAVRMNREDARQTGVEDYKAWGAAYLKLENRNRAAFHLLGLLTGGRPGDLCKIKYSDINFKRRTIRLSNPKAGLPIDLPMSLAIVQAIQLARSSAPPKDRNSYLFPSRGGGHLTQFNEPGLPAFGNSLRHAFRNMLLEVDASEVVSRILMGHSLKGVNEDYLNRQLATGGSNVRQMQRRISRRIMDQLGLSMRQVCSVEGGSVAR